MGSEFLAEFLGLECWVIVSSVRKSGADKLTPYVTIISYQCGGAINISFGSLNPNYGYGSSKKFKFKELLCLFLPSSAT
jgi:hypothetical protein